MKLRVFQPRDGRGVRLAGTGAYLPAHVVTNAALVAEGAPLSPDEIVRLCGIHTRHRAAPHEATSDLATRACERALRSAGRAPAEVDRLVLATVSPDHPTPATACLVQHALGLDAAPAHDLTATCAGFLYALDVAARAVVTSDERVLACAADIRSRFVDVRDRATAALFGDGAGAALLEPGPPGRGLVAVGLAADGSGARSVHVPAGGSREPASAATVAAGRHHVVMDDGPLVYAHAIEGMTDAATALLDAVGLPLADVALVLPHQANLRIVERVARRLGLPRERFWINVDRVGNVSGATVAIALDEALRSGAVSAGSHVLLVGAGAGYTVGAALVTV